MCLYALMSTDTGNRKRTLDRKGPAGKWVEPGM